MWTCLQMSTDLSSGCRPEVGNADMRNLISRGGGGVCVCVCGIFPVATIMIRLESSRPEGLSSLLMVSKPKPKLLHLFSAICVQLSVYTSPGPIIAGATPASHLNGPTRSHGGWLGCVSTSVGVDAELHHLSHWQTCDIAFILSGAGLIRRYPGLCPPLREQPLQRKGEGLPLWSPQPWATRRRTR
ncbi:hypothetical protein BJY01DRAFT_202188 [Aspergillus pseudoustus]|uniref:Amino acid permease/ SLC12A domain-containing protein n=1 Tax=Aspergillus pseudoustus TaxID=1810923 RepID=A0ABR4KZW8_9EURO